MSKTDFAQQLVSYGWKSQFISIVVYPEIIIINKQLLKMIIIDKQ